MRSILVVSLSLVLGLRAFSETLYVDPLAGSDARSGLSPSEALRTLPRAQALARERSAAAKEDLVVQLGEGTYRLDAPLVFTAADSGREGARMRYRAAPGANPVLSGGTVLDGWTLHDAASNIWKHAYDGPAFRELYVDGRLAIRARAPNVTQPGLRGPYLRTLDSPAGSLGYRVSAKDLEGLPDLAGAEMVVQPHWYHNRFIVKSATVSGPDALLLFDSPRLAGAFAKTRDFYVNNAYHFEGALAFLDAPGEWCLDARTRCVYYIPEKGSSPEKSSVVAGRLEVLVDVAGTPESPVSYLSFEGLGFSHTDWQPLSENILVATQALQPLPLDVKAGAETPPPAAVRARFARHLDFVGCRFVGNAANGLQFVRGVKHSRIAQNRFEEIGGNAVNLDAFARLAPSATDLTEHIVVSDNRLTRFGRSYNGAGILASFVADTVIEHNAISEGPYIGIQLGNQSYGRPDAGMKHNLVRYNRISRVMLLQDDGGAIYTLGPQPGSSIAHNYIEDIRRGPWAMGKPIAGIYLDNDTQHFEVTGNALIHVGSPVYLQLNKGTKDNTLRGNDSVPDDALLRSSGPRQP